MERAINHFSEAARGSQARGEVDDGFFFQDEQNKNPSQGFPEDGLISCIDRQCFHAKVEFHYQAASL